jgi:hypothetical protein
VNYKLGGAPINQPDVLLVANLKLESVVKRLKAEFSSLKQGNCQELSDVIITQPWNGRREP